MLVKNALLEEIAAQLAANPFDMGGAVDAYVDQIIVSKGIENAPSRKQTSWQQIVGRVAEIGIYHTLREIAKPYGPKINLDPLLQPIDAVPYTFRYDSFGNLHAYIREEEKSFAEYDAFFLADGLPVMVEVKIECKQNGKRKYRTRWLKSITPERWEYKLHPLEQYFGCFGGYLVMVTSEMIGLNSSIKQQFLADGGIIVPFPMDGETYKRQLTQALVERLVEKIPKTI